MVFLALELTFASHDEAKDGAPGTVVEHVSLSDEGLSQPVGGVDHHHTPEAQLDAVQRTVLLCQPFQERNHLQNYR